MNRRSFISMVLTRTASMAGAAAAGSHHALAVDSSEKENKEAGTVKGISHVGLSVTDMERSVHFYRDLMGMELQGVVGEFGGELYEAIFMLEGARGKSAWLTLGSMSIELFEFEHPKAELRSSTRPVNNIGIYHTAFEVGDVDKEYERLKAAGVSFHTPPLSFEGVGKATYGRDPDGNVFELLQWYDW